MQVARTRFDPKDFLPTLLSRTDLTGVFHFVQCVLDGFGKIACIPCNGSRMTRFMREQPSKNFSACIDPEKGAQSQEQIGGLPRVRRSARVSPFHRITQPSVAQEDRISKLDVFAILYFKTDPKVIKPSNQKVSPLLAAGERRILRILRMDEPNAVISRSPVESKSYRTSAFFHPYRPIVSSP
jgi:hypothetical protein